MINMVQARSFFRIELVELLIEYGADIEKSDKQGKAQESLPLCTAYENQDTQLYTTAWTGRPLPL